MKTFSDEWRDDLSEFKKLSFEDVAKSLQENRLTNTLNFLNRFEKNTVKKTDFPDFPSGQRREWRIYYGNELADAFFGGEQSRTGGPGDEVKIYDETGMFEGPTMSGSLYLDYNRNKKFDGRDEALFDIKVYISYDGAKLLRAWRTVESTVKDNEVLVFLENNKDDTNSGTVMMARAGRDARKKLGEFAGSDRISDFLNKAYKITKEEQKELLRSALKANIFIRALKFLINNAARILAWPADKLGDLFEWIGEKIEGLKIGESAYLSKTETSEKLKEHQERMAEMFKYFFQERTENPDEIPTSVEDYRILLNQLFDEAIAFILDHDAEELLQMVWAAICGIINGIIDFIAGIFKFIGLVLHLIAKLIRAGGDVLANIGYYQLLVAEYQDNFTQALRKIDWKKVMADAMAALSNIDFKRMFVSAGATIIKTDERKLAYYGGYIAVNVVLLIVPITDVVQFVRIGKFIAEFPLIEKLLSKLGSLVSKTQKTASSKLEKLLIYFEDIVDTFKQGTHKVSEIIQELIDEFRIWLEELVGLKRGESLIDKTVRTLQETLQEVVVKAKTLKGHIAQEIKDWLVRRYKMTRAALELLEGLGVTITRNAKNMARGSRVLTGTEGYIVKYGGEEIFEGTGDDIRRFSKKIEDIKRKEGKKRADQWLNERKENVDYVKSTREVQQSKNLQGELAGMAQNIKTTKDVKKFLESAKKLESILPDEALQYLDEALVHFNHEVIDGVVVQISDTNCLNVVQKVIDFLLTGKISKAPHSNIRPVTELEDIYNKTFLSISVPSLQKVMKNNEIGIIFGVRGPDEMGHVFNVIKIENNLKFIDAQVGTLADLQNGYKLFKYLKVKN
jgi:hypothetical protein